jgi:hypothetical protein
MSSTNEDWFVIKDLDNFINATRALVFNNFGRNKDEEDFDSLAFSIHPDDIEEIDKILSFDESKTIIDDFIKKQKHKNNNSIRFLINDNLYLEMLTSLNDRMVSNILHGLVNKGLVETAYDEDQNDFVFWIKDIKDIK